METEEIKEYNKYGNLRYECTKRFLNENEEHIEDSLLYVALESIKFIMSGVSAQWTSTNWQSPIAAIFSSRHAQVSRVTLTGFDGGCHQSNLPAKGGDGSRR